MAYIGTPPQSGFITTAKQRVTSSTNNYVDLDNSISSLADVIVWVNSVKQDSTNLTLTTSTRITLGGTLTASDVVEIAYLGKAVATQTPAVGTVTLDMLSASGTKSSSTFLRGDNTFASSFDVTNITGATELAENPAKTDEILINDNGTLKRVDLTHLYPTPIVHARMDTTPDASTSVAIKLNLDTEVIDSDGKFDTSTNRFTPTIAGYYLIFGMVEFINVNGSCSVFIKKNGTEDSSNIGRGIHGQTATSSDEVSPNIMSIVYLDADDYVEIWAEQTSGATRQFRYGRMLAFKLNHGGTAS